MTSRVPKILLCTGLVVLVTTKLLSLSYYGVANKPITTAPPKPAATKLNGVTAATPTLKSNLSRDCVTAFVPTFDPLRAAHMRQLAVNIGTCAITVPAAPRDDISRKTAKELGTKYDYAVLDDKRVVRARHNGKFHKGNMPNAITHQRMWRKFVETDHPDDHWGIFFEDDVNLHEKAKKIYSNSSAVARLLQWSFAQAEKLSYNMISYGVCLTHKGECKTLRLQQDVYTKHVQLSECRGDIRCAQAYAMKKRRARLLSSAWMNATAGAPCITGLWGKNTKKCSCALDPFFISGYLNEFCTAPSTEPACRMLVVGTNFIAPTHVSRHKGLFIQDRHIFGRTMTRNSKIKG